MIYKRKEKKEALIYYNPYVCAECGYDKVQTKMWVEINTDKVIDCTSDGEREGNWCPRCGIHDKIVTGEEFMELEKIRLKDG